MDFPEEQEVQRGELNVSNVKMWSCSWAWFESLPTKNVLLSSEACESQALLSIFLLPAFQWWHRRKGEEEKGKVRKKSKHFSLSFFLIIIILF